MTLQAILDCAGASFDHFDENRVVWMEIRGHCEDLLGTEHFHRYQELFQKDGFDYEREENRLTDWENFLKELFPNDVSVYEEGRYDIDDYFDEKSLVARERLIAYHQLKAFSLYIRGQSAQVVEAYHQFLVIMFFFFA